MLAPGSAPTPGRALSCRRPGCLRSRVTAREQTGDGEFYRLVLAYDNFTNLFREGVNGVSHPEIICGNATIRKCGVLTGFRLRCASAIQIVRPLESTVDRNRAGFTAAFPRRVSGKRDRRAKGPRSDRG